MTYDLTTIGEGQIRLTVDRGERLSTCRGLRVSPAGSEANVAGLLAQLGRNTAWASILPEGDLPTRFLQEYRSVGVDLTHVKRIPEGRMALYFMEPGDPPLPARVTYDRQHTPFRDAAPADFDWPALLDTRILFVTGITAALTANTTKLIVHAVDQAAALGVPVALDVNFRSLLWTPEQARAALEPLLEKLTILLCSRQDGTKVFGVDPAAPNPSEELRNRYHIPHVVSTDGTNAVHYADHGGPRSFPIRPVAVIDRPGAGDSFVGGTLHGFLEGDLAGGVEYGIRASSYALTHYGDLTHLSRGELEASHSGDILR